MMKTTITLFLCDITSLHKFLFKLYLNESTIRLYYPQVLAKYQYNLFKITNYTQTISLQ